MSQNTEYCCCRQASQTSAYHYHSLDQASLFSAPPNDIALRYVPPKHFTEHSRAGNRYVSVVCRVSDRFSLRCRRRPLACPLITVEAVFHPNATLIKKSPGSAIPFVSKLAPRSFWETLHTTKYTIPPKYTGNTPWIWHNVLNRSVSYHSDHQVRYSSAICSSIFLECHTTLSVCSAAVATAINHLPHH